MSAMSKTMRFTAVPLLLAVMGLSLAGCLANKPPVVRGVVQGNVTWSGHVLLAGDVLLDQDARLTILPGTKVRFLAPEADAPGLTEHPNFPGSELIVRGRLMAVGTPEQPIVFEAAEASAPAGAWGAINLEDSREAVFEYCVFRQADSAIHSRDSDVYIEQSLFENNLVGIRFHDSQILIERNLLRNNQTAIRFHFGSPVICENQFINNRVNLFVTAEPRDYHIENNSFGEATDYQVVLGESVPEDLRIPRNHWPLNDPAALIRSFYDGRRSDYLGKVLFDPPRSTPSAQAGLSWSP